MRYLTFFLALLCVSVSVIADDADIYSATVDLSSGPDAKKVALRQALHQVMIKVTGISDDALLNTVSNKLEPNQLLSAYRVQSQQSAANLSGLSASITASFDKEQLDRSLTRYGLPIWRDRPRTLMWLLIETDHGRQLITEDEVNPLQRSVVATLRHIADSKGLSVDLPIGDGEDMRMLSLSDIWGLFEAPVRKASLRYGAQTILIGRLYLPDKTSNWQGQWLLLSPHTSSRWRTNAQSPPDNVGYALGKLAMELMNQYASFVVEQKEADGQLRLSIDNVQSVGAYHKITAYLQNLAMISQVDVEEVAPPKLVMKISLKGKRAQLEEALKADRLLHLSLAWDGQPRDGLNLTYEPQ